MGTKLGMQVLLSFPGSDDRCYFSPQIHARRFVFRRNPHHVVCRDQMRLTIILYSQPTSSRIL